jgi:cytochrome c556
MTRTTLLATAACGLSLMLAAAATAAGNPVEQRQALMKEVGKSMKDAAGYATGKTPWDAANAKAVMAVVSKNARSLKGLYPPGSDKDPKSEALPAIWANKADFEKKLAEMGSAAEAAGKASDQAAFQTAFREVGKTCAACHNTYRKKAAA